MQGITLSQASSDNFEGGYSNVAKLKSPYNHLKSLKWVIPWYNLTFPTTTPEIKQYKILCKRNPSDKENTSNKSNYLRHSARQHKVHNVGK